MKKLLLNNPLVTMWKDAIQENSFIAYLSVAWITLLIVLFIIGFGSVVTAMILDPNIWDNAQFGIYDTLGT